MDNGNGNEDFLSEEYCPMCDGNDNVLLGSLGKTTYLKCTCCGWNFSTSVQSQSQPIEEQS